MNYSFMSFSTPDFSLKESLETAKRYGYVGFEPRLGLEHAHGIETSASAEFLVVARKVSEEIGVTLCCLATSCTLAIPGEELATKISEAKRVIDLANKIQCCAIRVFGGNLPDELSREKATDTLKQSLTQLATYAKGSNVYVCLETHDDWCDPFIVSEVAKESGCAVNWDIMHTILTAKSQPEDSFKLLKPYIRHIHVHDGIRNNEERRLVPIGKGEVDHSIPIKLLKESGYSGFISGEWIGWEPWEIHLPRELELLKNLENLA